MKLADESAPSESFENGGAILQHGRNIGAALGRLVPRAIED